tara:strand:+ start:90 stop:338 length:249 start_codon:yes stop_codon:yes gene_type:complete
MPIAVTTWVSANAAWLKSSNTAGIVCNTSFILGILPPVHTSIKNGAKLLFWEYIPGITSADTLQIAIVPAKTNVLNVDEGDK